MIFKGIFSLDELQILLWNKLLEYKLFLEMSMHSAENGIIFEVLSAFIKVATTVIEIAIKWEGKLDDARCGLNS